jgi:hypothetical protein
MVTATTVTMTLRHRPKKNYGQTIVEFSLVIFMTLNAWFFLFGMYQWVFVRMSVRYATWLAARSASVGGNKNLNQLVQTVLEKTSGKPVALEAIQTRFKAKTAELAEMQVVVKHQLFKHSILVKSNIEIPLW